MLDKKYVSGQLTPSPEEQTFLILSGKCPHNKGWTYIGKRGDDDEFWACKSCAEYFSFDRYGKVERTFTND